MRAPGLRSVPGRLRSSGADLIDRVRTRWPVFDHGVRALQSFGRSKGGQLAAGVTYFAFLSIFPLIALAYSALGFVVEYVPGAADAVTDALQAVLPGLVGTGSGQFDVQKIAESKAGAGLIGLFGMLYTGTGWVGALRQSLDSVFWPEREKGASFPASKLRDLAGLITIGLGLIISVVVATAVSGWADHLVDALGLSGIPAMPTLMRLLSLLLGIGAMTVLFFATYRLLSGRGLPARGLWQGALLAAVGFELLRQLASLVLRHVTNNPLYGAFAITVAMLVWINYTSRLIILGATWAVTDAEAVSAAEARRAELLKRDYLEEFGLDPLAGDDRGSSASGRRGSRVLAVIGALGSAAAGWHLGRRRAGRRQDRGGEPAG